MLSGMPSKMLLIVLLSLLTVCVTQTTNARDCCAIRNVLGTSAKSGTYYLKDANDTRCPDGCLYSKGDLDACFKPNVKYVTSCDQASTPSVTTPSVTTPSVTTPSETTPSVTTPSYIDIWNMDKTLFTPQTIANRGEWGPDEFCTEGSYAVSFQLYVAEKCTKRCKTADDDVALMGVKLFCADYYNPSTILTEISSSVMSDCIRGARLKCEWKTIHSCPAGQFTWKSRYLSEYFHDVQTTGEGAAFTCPPGPICRNETVADSDPMGGLNMDMSCTDGTDLIGDGIMASQVPLVDGEVTTYLSEWTECPPKYAICGIRSRVFEGETDKLSNMGQTEVLFHCCQLPPEFYN